MVFKHLKFIEKLFIVFLLVVMIISNLLYVYNILQKNTYIDLIDTRYDILRLHNYNLKQQLIINDKTIEDYYNIIQYTYSKIDNQTYILNNINTELDMCLSSKYILQNDIPKPLKLARAVNKSRPYELGIWDCSDMSNEWVKRMWDNGYPDANFTCGMYMQDGKAISHAWGTYTQHIEITNPRFIDGLEIGSKYIYQPWKNCLDNEIW